MRKAAATGLEFRIPASFDSAPFQRRSLKKGAIIRHPDDDLNQVYLIESGRIVGLFLGPQGHDVAFPEMGAGDCFGDLSRFSAADPVTYFEALEDSVVLALGREQFAECFRAMPELAELYAATLFRHLLNLKQLYIESRLLPMKARLYAELIRLANRDHRGRLGISPAPTHAELAQRVASQRETVTKQMSQLAKMGIIDSSRSQIVITDEAYLRTEISKSLGTPDTIQIM
jgi:CRP-like cAMP-binding protein